MSQGRQGNQTIVASFEVRYQYEINGQVYTGRNILTGSPKISYYLEKVKNSGYKQPVIVRYDLKTPNRSLIEF